MQEVAEIQHLPFHPGGGHFRLDLIAVFLRHHRIGGAMNDADGGLDVARLGRCLGDEVAMDADDGLHIGAVTREFEHIAAAEAEADRHFLRCIADAALFAFGHQRIERGADAGAALLRIVAQIVGERNAGRRLGDQAVAIHVREQRHIFLPGHLAHALDRQRRHAHPVRRHQHQRARAFHAFIIDERALRGDAAGLIGDRLDGHRVCPACRMDYGMTSPISPASYCVK
jgi:hypothetical protein